MLTGVVPHRLGNCSAQFGDFNDERLGHSEQAASTKRR